MSKENKTTQIVVRTTKKQKEFLVNQAESEGRTISSIINISLSKSYPKFKKLGKEKGD